MTSLQTTATTLIELQIGQLHDFWRVNNLFVQTMLRGPQINYKPDKSHVMIIITTKQGQIVQNI